MDFIPVRFDTGNIGRQADPRWRTDALSIIYPNNHLGTAPNYSVRVCVFICLCLK